MADPALEREQGVVRQFFIRAEDRREPVIVGNDPARAFRSIRPACSPQRIAFGLPEAESFPRTLEFDVDGKAPVRGRKKEDRVRF
ncbi:hypothetical protein HKCCE2091_10200 [Rhodobacterales bacterium HKCCE2091]|nr:hypothetical protein [Rhodobacterales bacterium HKCCE2091]